VSPPVTRFPSMSDTPGLGPAATGPAPGGHGGSSVSVPATTLAELRDAIAARAPGARVEVNAPLAPLTTFRLGGTADMLVTVRTEDDAAAVARCAYAAGVPLVALGGGSNVLVADAGVRGVVLRFHGGEVREDTPGTVRADAGVTINTLVRWLIGRGLAGLEAWAGTPGTVGGAVYGNAHFQGRLISEAIVDVRLLRPDGTRVDVPAAEMEFGYDDSRLQRTGELVVSARFAVTPGDPARLRAIARESLAFRKRTQPLHMASAGCIFQNPGPDEPLPAGMPRSAGALVDRAGLKGRHVGAALVSPVHANFIVIDGPGSARDVHSLIEQAREAVAARFGVRLREEIVRLGDWSGVGTSESNHDPREQS
jgi:UDP-N-acetylmuramate dehydrogenase